MSVPTVVLGIELKLRTTEAGGRTRPLDPSWYQYRPNWGFAGLDHPRGQAGAPVLCWRDSPMAPGDTTFVAIQPMYPENWGEVDAGDVLYLYEGARLWGVALVSVRETFRSGHGRSRQVIEPDGEIVAEFFDIGRSRSLPWKRRPEAARLLETFRDARRGFDGVVIGEPQRSFYGNQLGLTFPVFAHFGVELWVPEVGGAVDSGSEAHDLVMSLYGGMSKGERMRIKTRVRSAMASQAAIEGRFLGGRPSQTPRRTAARPSCVRRSRSAIARSTGTEACSIRTAT